MPGKDDISLLKEIRNRQILTPVILLSGRYEDTAQVKGLGLGADDCMTMPFSKTVLVSKIRAIIRRTQLYASSAAPAAAIPTTAQYGHFTLQLGSQTVLKDGREIPLSSKEFALLCYFVEHPDTLPNRNVFFFSSILIPHIYNNFVIILSSFVGNVCGSFCQYTPSEIIMAAGLYQVGLCGKSAAPIKTAETRLPANLCPLIKASYGHALEQSCPYAYFSDVIVGETTCDGKKKMYELLSRQDRVYFYQVAQGADREYVKPLILSESRYLIKELKKRFDVDVTDTDLRTAGALFQQERQSILELMDVQRQIPPATWRSKPTILIQTSDSLPLASRHLSKCYSCFGRLPSCASSAILF